MTLQEFVEAILKGNEIIVEDSEEPEQGMHASVDMKDTSKLPDRGIAAEAINQSVAGLEGLAYPDIIKKVVPVDIPQMTFKELYGLW